MRGDNIRKLDDMCLESIRGGVEPLVLTIFITVAISTFLLMIRIYEISKKEINNNERDLIEWKSLYINL